jgi:hypothetical protein
MRAKDQEMKKQINRMSRVYVLVKMEEKMQFWCLGSSYLHLIDKQREPLGFIAFQSSSARTTTSFAPFVAVTGAS